MIAANDRALAMGRVAGGPRLGRRCVGVIAIAPDGVPVLAAPKSSTVAADAGLAAPRGRINPTKRTLRFIVPLNDGLTYLGDVDLSVSPSDRLSVAAPRFLQLVEPLLKPEVLARVKIAVAGQDLIDEAALGASGIKLSYDSQSLALALQLPVGARRTRSLSLRADRQDGVETLKPARVSGFINFRSAMELVEAGPGRGVPAPVSAIDGAVRVFDMVAEGETYVSLRHGDQFYRRAGTRLIYDDTRRLIRTSAGDVRLYPRYFQSGPSVAGLSIGRSYSLLDPQQDIRSSGAQSFVIDSPSVVETIVNGRSVERKTFQPGSYTLQDFPLAEGSNDVKLLIREDSGKQRVVNFSLYSNRALLEPGRKEFSVFAGVLTEPTLRGITYSRHWLASGFVRAGLTPRVTAGVNFQADRFVQQGGAEALVGTPIGLVGFDLAAAHRVGRSNGFAGAVSFEHTLTGNVGAGQSLHVLVEAHSRYFAAPSDEASIDSRRWRAAAGYSLSFGRDRFLSLDADVLRDRVRGTSASAHVTGGTGISELFSMLGEIEYRRGNGQRDLLFRVSLRRRLGTRGQARLDLDSKGGIDVSAQESGGRGTGAWLADGDFKRDPQGGLLTANGGYLANRLELGGQQSVGFNAGGGVIGATTTLRAGTSIAFADGSFAIGRPVINSFLIGSTHRSLKNRTLRLDPQENSEAARSDRMGPALEGDLSAYSRRTLVYDVDNAPAGYDLGAGNVSLVPPYHGGFKMIVGSDYNLLVLGRLIDREGEPVTLLAGKAIELVAPKRPAITLFTSRDGKFGAQGLRPGQWRIVMPTADGDTSYDITVTTSETGTIRLGDIRPSARNAQ